ncbi:hypothetical protein ACFLQ0_01345 [Nitrospinota bacterium]
MSRNLQREIDEDRTARLHEIAEQIEAAATRADFGALVRGLAAARAACENCHTIFQEADSSGTPPNIPPFRR